MTQYNGRKRSIALLKQDDIDTPQTSISGATYLRAAFPLTPGKDPGLVMSEGATGSDIAVYTRVPGETNVAFPIEFAAIPNDTMGHALYAVFGDDTVSTVSGATTHTYTLRGIETSIPAYTVFCDKGYEKKSYESFQWSSFEMSIAAGDTTGVTITLDGAAQDEVADSNTYSPSWAATPLQFAYKNLCVDINDGSYGAAPGTRVYGITYKIDRQGERKSGSCQSGKQLEYQNGPGVIITVTLDLWVEADYVTEYYDKFLAAESLDVNFKLEGDSLGSADDVYTFEANLPDMRIISDATPTIEDGPMKASVTLQLDGDYGDTLQNILMNAQASTYASM